MADVTALQDAVTTLSSTVVSAVAEIQKPSEPDQATVDTITQGVIAASNSLASVLPPPPPPAPEPAVDPNAPPAA